MVNHHRSTTVITRSGRRLSGADSFFGRFAPAWSSVSREVLKLETRQEYREPGNPSWEKFAEGDFDEALRLLPQTRSVDVPLYDSLSARGVRFTRCRPVSFPITPYLRWEIACYDFNSKHGESILFVAIEDVAALMSDYLHHDFMVFDDTIAFVHDYDQDGEIRGGWETTDRTSIVELTELFTKFREHSRPYKEFLQARPEWHTVA